ncbi:MAG: hypothetical protein ACTTKL_06295 [Treponema sp.]
MKRNALFVTLAGVSLLLAATAVTGCGHSLTDGSKNGKVQPLAKALSDGSTDDTKVQPTGEADPALKGVRFESASDESIHEAVTIVFADNDGNIASVNHMDATYTVSGSTVSFDLSQYVKIWESMTVEKYLEMNGLTDISEEEKAELEKEIEKDKEIVKTLKPYETFDGTLNEGNFELTVEKFPVVIEGKYEVKNLVFVKK